MNITLDQIKGILQVIIPVLVASFAPKYIPPDQLTNFDSALITVIVTVLAAFWSAKTTKTGNGQ